MTNSAEKTEKDMSITEGRLALERDFLNVAVQMMSTGQNLSDTVKSKTDVYTRVWVDDFERSVNCEGEYQGDHSDITLVRDLEYDRDLDLIIYFDSVSMIIDGQEYTLRVRHYYPENADYKTNVQVQVNDHMGFQHVYNIGNDGEFIHTIYRFDGETNSFDRLDPDQHLELSYEQLGTAEQIDNCMRMIRDFPQLNRGADLSDTLRVCRLLLKKKSY